MVVTTDGQPKATSEVLVAFLFLLVDGRAFIGYSCNMPKREPTTVIRVRVKDKRRIDKVLDYWGCGMPQDVVREAMDLLVSGTIQRKRSRNSVAQRQPDA